MKKSRIFTLTAALLIYAAVFLSSVSGQDTPGTLKYPTSQDNATSLFQVADRARTTLKAPLGIGDTTATVSSTVDFPQASSLVINGNEIAFYTSKDATHFYGLVRARENTIATAASVGVSVEGRILAVHHNTLAEMGRKLQRKLGTTDSVASNNAFLIGTGVGSSAWRPLASADVTTALGYTPADSSLGLAPALTSGGVADNSVALAAAITTADATNSPIYIKGGVYGFTEPLPSTSSNISIICKTGDAIFRRLPGSNGTAELIAGAYRGWRFEGIEFDGNARNATVSANVGSTVNLSNAYDVTFLNCTFRDQKGLSGAQGGSRLSFLSCRVYGTLPGVMQAGVQSPSANSAALYRAGFQFTDGCTAILFENCDFHFCSSGITTVGSSAGASMSDSVRGVTIRGCRFRGDWFNGPFKTGEFTVSATSGTFYATNFYIDIASGSFNGLFDDIQTVCFPVQVAAGSSLTGTYANVITASSGFASAQIGDVIETSDGRRAEVLHATSATQVEVAGWESIDTFEPTTAPALSVTWKLMRYYSTTAQEKVSSTRIRLYQVPVNMFTGHTILTDGITLTGRTFRTFAKIGYAGTHINNSSNVLIEGNTFRGSWADQISNFYCRQLRIQNNRIEYGEDEAMTVAASPGSAIEGNAFRNSGAGIFIGGGSTGAIFSGNSIHNWNLHYGTDTLGAVHAFDLDMLITGNSFSFDSGLTHQGFSGYAVTLYNSSCAGTRVTNNQGSGRIGEVYADGSIVSATVLDMTTDGPGASLITGLTGSFLGSFTVPYDSAGDNSNALNFRNSTGSGNALSLSYRSGGALGFFPAAEFQAIDFFAQTDASTPMMTLRMDGGGGSDGNVGFGIAGPSGRMHMSPSNRGLILQQRADAATMSQLEVWDTANHALMSVFNNQFRIYNLASGFGEDRSGNYENFFIKPIGNVYTFGSEAGGTGVARPFNFTGANVGIGAAAPGSKLTVAGIIESTTGGVKFPDATVQTTAATGEQLLAVGVVIDMNSIGNQDLYTVPDGKTLVITRVIARAASEDMTGQALRIYSSETTNRLISIDLISLATASGYDIITLNNENLNVDSREIIGAGFKVQAHPKTAYGGPATLKVDLFGYLY